MSIYVNNGDGERELREIETPDGVVTSVSVNHGDGDGEQTVWSSLSQMALQFDARQLALDDGDPVAEWETTAGDLTAAQSSTDNQPTYVSDGVGGNPSVQFDGEQYLEVGYFDEDDVLEQPYTWAAVLQHDPTGEYDYVFYGADADERSFLELTPENTTRLWAGETGGIETESQGQIVVGVVDGEESLLRVVDPATGKEEELAGNAGLLSHVGLTIGAHSDGSRGFEGSIAELRGYDWRLNADERGELIGMLESEWEPNYTPPEPESSDATWEITYDDHSYDQLYDWTSNYSSFVNDEPSARGETSLEWRHRKETNHGNTLIKFSEYTEELGTEGMAKNGRPYEFFYEALVYMPTDIPTASNGDYTMRFGFGGLSTGDATSGSGSPSADGTNGWYTVPMWDTHNNGSPSGDEVGFSINMRLPGGSTIENEYTSTTIVPDNDWHHFGFYFNANSWSGSTMDGNGVQRWYWDEELVWSEEDRNFTSTEDHLPEYTGSQWNFLRYGGTASTDFEWYWDAVNIYVGSDIPEEVRAGVERDWW